MKFYLDMSVWQEIPNPRLPTSVFQEQFAEEIPDEVLAKYKKAQIDFLVARDEFLAALEDGK